MLRSERPMRDVAVKSAEKARATRVARMGLGVFVWGAAAASSALAATPALIGLGDLPGGPVQSAASGVSSDGTAVVGWSAVSSGLNEAFRWTSAGGMVGLGDLPGGTAESWANAISADGSTVVGLSNSTSGYEAFRWTSGGGMTDLGDLEGGLILSNAFAVSHDGSTVAGRGTSAASKSFQ